MKDTVSQPAGGRGATAPRPADAASPSCGSSPSADSLSVVLAGGGTAGHVEPAMAVADALVALDPRVRITALGTLRGLETRLVPQRGYHLELITAVPMPRKPGGDLARLPSRVWRAVREARDVLDDVDADVVVGFGGYVALPAYLAARGLPCRPAPAPDPGGDPRSQRQGGTGQPGRRPYRGPGALRGAGFRAAARRGGWGPGPCVDRRAGPRGAASRGAGTLRLPRRRAGAAGVRGFAGRGLAQPGGVRRRRRPGRRRCLRAACPWTPERAGVAPSGSR